MLVEIAKNASKSRFILRGLFEWENRIQNFNPRFYATKNDAMTNLGQTELPIFIPFTSDYGFKVTFGNEENTLFLHSLISNFP